MEKFRPEQGVVAPAPETAAEKRLPDFLQDATKGAEAFKEARKPWESISVLLSDKWRKELAETLHPEDIGSWDKSEKLAYLESLGRLLPELELCNWQLSAVWQERLLGECRRLADKLGDKSEAGVRSLLKAGAIFSAVENDSNTAGASGRNYDALVSAAAAGYGAEKDPDAVEALVNPYHLAPGMEIVFWDRETKKLRVEPVQDMASGEGGIVALAGTLYDLKDFNKSLAIGATMLKSGENNFGGLEQLRTKTVDRFRVGRTIKYRHPLSSETLIFKITGSNQPELEAEYGPGFMQYASRALKIDVETADGKINRGVDASMFGRLEEAEG